VRMPWIDAAIDDSNSNRPGHIPSLTETRAS
jgi:hypothetical protein